MVTQRELELYIQNTDWDLDYKHGKVKNILGQEYNVHLEKAESCAELLGWFRAGDHKIVVKEPCEGYLEDIVASNEVELAAYTLAHELGHADSYAVTYLVSATILAVGIGEALRKRSLRPFAYASAAFMGSQIFLNEILADTCATAFHNVPFMGAAYQVMPAIFDNINWMF